jgi:hypothetical protein
MALANPQLSRLIIPFQIAHDLLSALDLQAFGHM